MAQTFVTRSEQETVAIAEQLANTLTPGTFVMLYGDLGTGKTVFVRGLATGLGIDPGEVSSPTFVLVQHYRGPVPLTHVDLYRLDTGAAIEDLGLDELATGGVLAVEWAERMPQPMEGSVGVSIEDLGGDKRRITIVGSTVRPLNPGPYSDR
jgi:tRNA threonylcarbamoyladenosine biosynthesis protein TsaE